jgi:uncharacterized protein YpmB
MAEAVEFFKKDGTAAGVFYCSECRCVYVDKKMADWCHGDRLCACGKKIERGYHTEKCDKCCSDEMQAKEASKEAARFDKAKKITEAEYKEGMLYDGDRYFNDVEDAVEHYECNDSAPPEYLWACKRAELPTASAESIYENLLEAMWDDADTSDLYGVKELEAAVTAFNKENRSIQLWEPDYSTAILVEKRKESDEPV